MQIEKLKNNFAKRKITILGHDNIDVDAFLSGILLSKLFDFLKIENEFIILEEVKEDDTYQIVKELFNIDMKKWENVSEKADRYHMPKQAHRMMLQSNRMYARLKTIKQCFRLISWTMIQKRSWME